MKAIKTIAVALVLLLGGGSLTLSAQNRDLSGKILDAQQQPVIGAAVLVAGDAALGAVSDVDGSFQMCTKSSMYESIIKIAHVPKKHVLTEVLLETLSIVAYKQPITRQEIEAIRGVSCDHAVNKLVEYNLIQEVGRLDAPGRPILFGTTEEFLRSFGLVSLDDLPVINPEKVEDFKLEVEEEMQLSLEI